MPLIKPVSGGTVVVDTTDRLYEEFILSLTAEGIWVTNANHHIYMTAGVNDGHSTIASDVSGVIAVSDNMEISGNGNGSLFFDEHNKTDHWFLFNRGAVQDFVTDIPHRGHIHYESAKDDITFTDDFKYYAYMDTDMYCWQITKSKARESVVGTTTGIASSKYGVVKVVEINKSVATNADGSLSDELLGATLSAWTGYWKDTKSGKTIYYNAWKP